MADEDALARPSHTMFLVVFLQPLQSGSHRRVFLRLRLFRLEGVVTERIQSYRFWLVGRERGRIYRPGRASATSLHFSVPAQELVAGSQLSMTSGSYTYGCADCCIMFGEVMVVVVDDMFVACGTRL